MNLNEAAKERYGGRFRIAIGFLETDHIYNLDCFDSMTIDGADHYSISCEDKGKRLGLEAPGNIRVIKVKN